MSTFKGYAGRTADGTRLWVSIELTRHERPSSTVEHAEITEYVRLAIQGEGFHGRRKRDDIDFTGQTVDTLREVTQPAKGWTVTELQRLATLWERWHLNDMRAGCAHVTPVIETDQYGRTVPSLTLTPVCPVSGYRYGHAWLVEPLPAEVEAEIRAFGERLDGTTAL